MVLPTFGTGITGCHQRSDKWTVLQQFPRALPLVSAVKFIGYPNLGVYRNDSEAGLRAKED